MTKPLQIRNKVSAGLEHARLTQDVLVAFFNHDLKHLKELMEKIKGRTYSHHTHKLSKRSKTGDLFDLSFNFIEKNNKYVCSPYAVYKPQEL